MHIPLGADTQGLVALHAQRHIKFGQKSRLADARRRIKLGAVILRCASDTAAGVDVAIIGGGPGGLASAAALVSALGSSVRVKVTVALSDMPLSVGFTLSLRQLCNIPHEHRIHTLACAW